MQILGVYSSVFGGQAYSSQLVNMVVTHLQQKFPQSTVVYRDLHQNTPSSIDGAFIQALSREPADRSPEQRARIAEHDVLIAEVMQSDYLVIAAPMINFFVTAQLKVWLDAITRQGVTFQYTDKGPQGLVVGKKVILVRTTGGQYRKGDDPQMDFLIKLLHFIGLQDMQVIDVQGLRMDDATAKASMAAAEAAIARL